MKFNRRVGRSELTGAGTLDNDDIIAVIKILVELRNGRGEIDDIDHLGNRRVRSVGELSENQFRSGLVAGRARGERAPRPGRERQPAAARPDQRQADIGRDQGVLRCSQLSQFMDQTNPLVGDHAQAPRIGAGTRRSHARACRLRGARRAPDALRPRMPDRDAGRPEHRPHQLARALRAHQRVRLPRDAVPQGRERQGHRRDPLPLGDRGR